MLWRPADAKTYTRGLGLPQANSVVGTPARATTPRRVTIHTALTVPPVHIVLNNQEYLTAPCVMVVEGVLNGALIPGDELHAEDWNGVPVTIGHPQDTMGQPHSARQPEVLATCGVGHVFRVRQGHGQRQGHPVASLQGELWIHLGAVPACGPAAQQAVDMLETQTPLEVSTAFFSEAERTPGSFYGAVYHEVHRHLRPDHLALLPNDIGACDWQAGCGAPRLNHATLTYTSTMPAGCVCPGTTCTCHEGETPMTAQETPPTGWRRFVQVLREFVHQEEDAPLSASAPSPVAADGSPGLVTAMTDGDAREAIYGCLAREMGQDLTPIFIDSLDTETQTFTFRQGERLRRRRWHMQDGVLVLDPDTEDVQRTTSYTPVSSPPPEEQQFMARNTVDFIRFQNGVVRDREEQQFMASNTVKRWVDTLITHAQTTWTEDDRATLEAMPEPVLIRMAQDVQRLPQPPAAREGYLSVNEALDNVDPEQREAVDDAIQAYGRRKTQLIDILMANATNPFSREELQGMKAERLEKLVTMGGDLLPGQQPERQGQSYVGRRIPPIRLVTDEEAVPAPPQTMALVVERRKALGLM